MLVLLQNILLSKPGAISLVALLLLIPLMLIESKIRERAEFHAAAVAEISDSWTGAQTVLGPVIVVEYEESQPESYWSEKEGRFLSRSKHIARTALIPLESVHVDAIVTTQKRYRGIHEVRVFESSMKLTGSYQPDDFLGLLDQEGFHQIKQLYLWISVSDQRGFVDIPSLTWGDDIHRFSAGGHPLLAERGIRVDLQAEHLGEPANFESQFGLRGTHVLKFVPTGRSTDIQIASDWQHPKFMGQYLPSSRTVDSGFSANWSVTELATNISRDLKACANGKCNALMTNSLGVELIEPVNVYLVTERAVKYGVLFVGLVLALVLAAEITRDVDVHPIQYLMVGVALSIFYLLLIALSEHIQFDLAYGIATLMCGSLLTYYGVHILDGVRIGLGFGATIVMLFALLYVVLNAEDIALLLGTLVTFAVVTVLMVVTAKSENLSGFSLESRAST